MPKNSTINLPFPIKGLHTGFAAGVQPPQTAVDLKNVRPYDTFDNRLRGGQRPGLVKWGEADQISGRTQPIVAMVAVTYVEVD